VLPLKCLREQLQLCSGQTDTRATEGLDLLVVQVAALILHPVSENQCRQNATAQHPLENDLQGHPTSALERHLHLTPQDYLLD
jgi:hypothetical protein